MNKGSSSTSSEVGKALASLTAALEIREEQLNQREEELNSKEERLQSEIIDVYGNTGPSDVLHLNVGGTAIAVLRRTLTSVENSMLASKFSGRVGWQP